MSIPDCWHSIGGGPNIFGPENCKSCQGFRKFCFDSMVLAALIVVLLRILTILAKTS